MNTFYLHVGPHKTGTTAIQKFLLDNREQLFKSNLVYPNRFKRIFGHHDFRDALENKNITVEDRDFFAEKHDFLLSSEDFISLGKENFEYLRSVIESKNIVVVYAWRRASFKLYSIWQETIKHGATESFFSYYHNHLARPAQSQMLSADLKLNMFAHVFGMSNVKVLDYDAASSGNTLLKDFLQISDIPWQDSFVTPEKNKDATNKSMDFVDIEVIRALNYQFKEKIAVEGDWVRHQYVQSRSSLIEVGLEALKQIIADHKADLKIGNYFIDNRCERIMVDKFKGNIHNYQPALATRSLSVARPEWVFEQSAQQILGDLYNVLNDKNKK